jgi:hypothetical protein
MAQFLQTNGDYTIKTYEGGIITLDTGPRIGQIKVTGNLVVEGDTLTVSAENLDVQDNIIRLNVGETGAGVSLRYSGLEIDRGTSNPVSFFYDENDDSFNIAVGTVEGGSVNYSTAALRLRKILTESDTDAGDLTLIGTGSGVVKVEGTINYEQQITDDDDIPNKKYVDDSIRDNPTFQIIDDNSRVIISEKNVVGSLQYLEDETGYSTFGESGVSVLVDGILNTQFFTNRTVIQDIEILGNEITNNDTNANVYIKTQGTGKLQTNYAVELEEIAVTPAFVSGSTILHACTPGIGGSGVVFVGSNGVSDELISKNKALLLSMLF